MNTNQPNLLIIDLDILQQHELSIEDYIYMYLTYYKLSNYSTSKPNFRFLEYKGWIKNLQLTSKFEDIFLQNDCFEELLAHYPKQTPSGRKLHTDLNKAKELYNKKLKKNKTLQNIIIEAILTERRQRKERDTEEYFNNIYKYIKEENWKAYGPTREVITTEEINLL